LYRPETPLIEWASKTDLLTINIYEYEMDYAIIISPLVDNKVLRARETFNIRSSRHGEVLYQVQERKLRVRDTMKIEDGNGDEIAKIKKRAVGVVRDNFVVKVRGDRDWQIHGAILDHDFTVKENGKTIVKVHKNWVTPIKDCYFIDIDEGCDDKALALMVVIGLEDMSED